MLNSYLCHVVNNIHQALQSKILHVFKSFHNFLEQWLVDAIAVVLDVLPERKHINIVRIKEE